MADRTPEESVGMSCFLCERTNLSVYYHQGQRRWVEENIEHILKYFCEAYDSNCKNYGHLHVCRSCVYKLKASHSTALSVQSKFNVNDDHSKRRLSNVSPPAVSKKVKRSLVFPDAPVPGTSYAHGNEKENDDPETSVEALQLTSLPVPVAPPCKISGPPPPCYAANVEDHFNVNPTCSRPPTPVEKYLNTRGSGTLNSSHNPILMKLEAQCQGLTSLKNPSVLRMGKVDNLRDGQLPLACIAEMHER